MASSTDVQQRVIKVVCDVLHVESELVTSESNFVFDLGAESTQSVQLVAGFEYEFDIEMDNEQALTIQTVGDAVEFISKHLD